MGAVCGRQGGVSLSLRVSQAPCDDNLDKRTSGCTDGSVFGRICVRTRRSGRAQRISLEGRHHLGRLVHGNKRSANWCHSNRDKTGKKVAQRLEMPPRIAKRKAALTLNTNGQCQYCRTAVGPIRARGIGVSSTGSRCALLLGASRDSAVP